VGFAGRDRFFEDRSLAGVDAVDAVRLAATDPQIRSVTGQPERSRTGRGDLQEDIDFGGGRIRRRVHGRRPLSRHGRWPSCGARVAGLGAFTAIVGDGGITVAERAPIPVTTGNSLTVAAGVRSLFRGADEMGIDPALSTAVVVGATGSIGAACARLIGPRVRR